MSRPATPVPHPRLPVAALCLLALLAAALCMPSGAQAQAQAPTGFFGVNASGYESGDFERMAEADVGVTRNIFPFEVIRHGKDLPYNWSYTDPIVRGTAENGIDLIPMVYGAPPWVSHDLNRTVLKGEAARAWSDLLTTLVQRYGPGGAFWSENPTVPYRPIRVWQIWNEPNSITWWGPKPKPKDYGKVLVRSAAAIHAVDPEAQVMTAGIVAEPTNAHAILGKEFLAELFKSRAVREAADIVAYHPYAATVSGVRKQLKQARSALRSRGAGSTPLWITEIGWGTKGPRKHPLVKTTSGQIQVLHDTFEMVLSQRQRLGLGRLLWYQWRDGPYKLCKWCETSGLLTVDNKDKPLLGTFASIATR
ncbi:MAG: hypothetical protein U0R24_13935 [Solirubrobacterales bacterium]